MAFTGWETHTRQSNVRDQQKGQAKICLLPTQSSPLLEMEVEVEVELEIKCSNDNRGLGWWEDRRTAERSGVARCGRSDHEYRDRVYLSR